MSSKINSPIASVLREALRPKSVLNHHPRGHARWEWDALDGWRCDMALPKKDLIFTPIFTALFAALGVPAGFTIFGVPLVGVATAIATTSLTYGVQSQ